MRAAGLEPAWLFNIATAVTLLAGSRWSCWTASYGSAPGRWRCSCC